MGDRASRLRQAGLPLPAVIGDLLSHLLGNGRSASRDVLVKVVRDALEDLHGNRVLGYWDSWEDLTGDLLGELTDRGLMFRAGDKWTLTEKVHEGARLRVMTDIRITVYTPETRLRRDNIAYARLRARSYRSFLEEKNLFDGEIRDSFERHWDSLAWEEPESEEPAVYWTRRKRGKIADFMWEYLKAHPKGVTAREAAAAYNYLHPDEKPVRSSSAWNRLQQKVWEGGVEKEEGRVPGRPGRNHTVFRLKKEE